MSRRAKHKRHQIYVGKPTRGENPTKDLSLIMIPTKYKSSLQELSKVHKDIPPPISNPGKVPPSLRSTKIKYQR